MVDNNEYLNAKKRVQNFFNDEISFYVLPDINLLTNEIRPDSNGQKGCTAPLAMMLFSIIDLIGFLMREDENAKKEETTKNFEFLLSKSGFFPEIYSESNNWEKIVKLFRHGLIHQFFPKACAISKAGKDNPLIFEVKYGEKNIYNLNVDILSRDLVDVIFKIKEYISKNDGVNKEFILRMNRRLDVLAKEDYEDLDKLT